VGRRLVDPASAGAAAREERVHAEPERLEQLLPLDAVLRQPAPVRPRERRLERLLEPVLAEEMEEEVRLRGRPEPRVLRERPGEDARPRARRADDEDRPRADLERVPFVAHRRAGSTRARRGRTTGAWISSRS